MKNTTTERGFKLLKGKDKTGASYSLQKSSVATEDCIWLGIDNPDPVIMVSDAIKIGLRPKETNGWTMFDIPKEVLITTRMHLTVDMAKDLIQHLEYFVETGEL